MISIHDRPPFSIDARIADRSLIAKPGMRPLEVRLLAIENNERHSMVIGGLTYCLNAFAREKGYTHYLISGVTEQLALYRHIGFEALVPAKGESGAIFIPMIATLDRVDQQMKAHDIAVGTTGGTGGRDIGGTGFHAPWARAPGRMCAAFAEAPIYHRSVEFVDRFEGVREALGRLTKARAVAMTVGSGTLANESIASTLVAGPQPENGLVLVNGEFGRAAQTSESLRTRSPGARVALGPCLGTGSSRPCALSDAARRLGLGRSPGIQHRRDERFAWTHKNRPARAAFASAPTALAAWARSRSI